MAASVLKSDRAVEISLYVVRVFIQLRNTSTSEYEIGKKLQQLEQSVTTHDRHIQSLFEALRQLMAAPKQPKRRIGF
jgi:hypothetical protein